MKRERFRDKQIIGTLQENAAELSVKDTLRKYGIAEQTFYRWKNKFDGMQAGDAKCLTGNVDRRVGGRNSLSC